MESELPLEIDERELEKYRAIVLEVKKGSIAAGAGIKKGDRIITINGSIIRDLIDYQYSMADVNLKVLVERSKTELIEFEIEKDYEDDLGVSFEKAVFDEVMKCCNNCIFCFMAQMPEGMRETLYVHDDDYRLSFLYGNFITMTRMNEEDFERIKSLYLSPLYISVHTTNVKLRKQIMHCHKAENIMKQLEELTSSGISIHTQIVLMPGVNDGEELVKTIEDLSYFYPQLESIGIVPVGLTKYRDGLTPLKSFDKKSALEVINTVKPFQSKFRRRFDKSLVYLADEFYFLAEQPLPEGGEYDGYPQYENGIGIARSFQDDFHSMRNKIPSKLKYSKEFTLVTGVLGEKALANIINDLNTRVAGLKLNLVAVENEFFGEKITVSGLVTGRDIINHFQKNPRDIPENIVIPKIMLNDDRFLDDVTIDQMADELDSNVQIIDNDFESLLRLITG